MPYSASYIKNVQTGPYAGDEQEVSRKRKLAELLQEDAMSPVSTQGVVSPLHILAKGLAGYQSGRAAKDADETQKSLAERQKSERSAQLAAALRMGTGAEQPPAELGGGPAMPANPTGGMAQLAQSGDPAVMQMGMGPLQAMQAERMARLQAELRPKPAGPQPQLRDTPQGLMRIGAEGPAQPVMGPDNKPIPTMPKTPLVSNVIDNRQPGDDEYLKERRKQQATRYAELEKGAESAYKRMQTLDRFLEASKKGTAGGVQPVITATQNFLASFGYSPESLKNVAVMEQAIGDILGTKMQELGARGLTDRDMDILRQALPRVAIAPEAREAVVGILKKADEFTLNEYVNVRDQEAKNYPDFAKKTPTQGWLRDYQSRKPAGGAGGAQGWSIRPLP